MKLINQLPAFAAGMVFAAFMFFAYLIGTHQEIDPVQYYLVADSTGNIVLLETNSEHTMQAAYHMRQLTPEQYRYAYKIMDHKPLNKNNYGKFDVHNQ